MAAKPRAKPEEIEQVVRRVFAPFNQRISDRAMPQFASRSVQTWRSIAQRWQSGMFSLIPLGGASEGNRVTLYTDGDEAFTAKWDAVAKAKNHVLWSAWIVDPDPVGHATIKRLAAAKRLGCRHVALLYDAIGSYSLAEHDIAPLRAVGALPIPFNPVRKESMIDTIARFFPPQKFRLQHGPAFRIHQKILIADDIGFTGGMNIAVQYAGLKTGGNGRFFDAHIRVEGPAARDLQKIYINSLQESESAEASALADQLIAEMKERPPPAKLKDGVFVQALPSNSRKAVKALQKAMRRALNNAGETCYLTTPYFLPPFLLKRAIIKAVARGVDVRILTAGHSDVPTMRLASQHIYSTFLAHNVKIYEMFGEKTLHAKTAVIDGIYSYVGSFNLDRWSDSNLEVNLAVLDPELATNLERKFMDNLKLSTEIHEDDLGRLSLGRRFLSWSFYQFYTLFGPPQIESEMDEIELEDEDDLPLAQRGSDTDEDIISEAERQKEREEMEREREEEMERESGSYQELLRARNRQEAKTAASLGPHGDDVTKDSGSFLGSLRRLIFGQSSKDCDDSDDDDDNNNNKK